MGIEKLTDKQEKQEKIVTMFDDIASTYDLANRVLSMGIDIQWRKKGCDKAFEILGKKELEQITDVATGTGDLLIYWKEQAVKNGVNIKKYVEQYQMMKVWNPMLFYYKQDVTLYMLK